MSVTSAGHYALISYQFSHTGYPTKDRYHSPEKEFLMIRKEHPVVFVLPFQIWGFFYVES